MVFTTRLSGGSLHGTRGHNTFEHELHRLQVCPEELPTQPPHHNHERRRREIWR